MTKNKQRIKLIDRETINLQEILDQYPFTDPKNISISVETDGYCCAGDGGSCGFYSQMFLEIDE